MRVTAQCERCDLETEVEIDTIPSDGEFSCAECGAVNQWEVWLDVSERVDHRDVASLEVIS